MKLKIIFEIDGQETIIEFIEGPAWPKEWIKKKIQAILILFGMRG